MQFELRDRVSCQFYLFSAWSRNFENECDVVKRILPNLARLTVMRAY